MSIRPAERSAHRAPDAPARATAEFDAFVHRHEQRLRIALVATYGAVDGRVAALDALSWAWEHWTDVQEMRNPVGYLYRVGQTSTRRQRTRPIPIASTTEQRDDVTFGLQAELMAAVAQLPEQQRSAVMLTHAFGWTVREVARMMEIAPSTVQTHVGRGLERLRQLLEEDHG